MSSTAAVTAPPGPTAGMAELATARTWRPVELERHRALLLHHARRSLRNAADAEDAVQETLAAALTTQGFAGRSALGTWLYGILEHKIVDVYRRRAREPLLERPADDELRDEVDAMFTPDGHWRDAPAPLADPEAALVRREFRAVLEDCLACLPPPSARAFRMREMMDLEVDEICRTLGVTRNNCYVMLHRARMRLRTLLEQRWLVPSRARGQPSAGSSSANL